MIYLHLTGSPPHLDLFDYKPDAGQARRPTGPGRVHQGQAVRLHHGRAEVARHAAEIRAARPGGHLAFGRTPPTCTSVADELCVIKSMNTDQFNHAPAELLLLHRLAASGPALAGLPG